MCVHVAQHPSPVPYVIPFSTKQESLHGYLTLDSFQKNLIISLKTGPAGLWGMCVSTRTWVCAHVHVCDVYYK